MHTYIFLHIMVVKLINFIAAKRYSCLCYRFEIFFFVFNQLRVFLILKQPQFYQKVFNVGCFCFSLLKKYILELFSTLLWQALHNAFQRGGPS